MPRRLQLLGLPSITVLSSTFRAVKHFQSLHPGIRVISVLLKGGWGLCSMPKKAQYETQVRIHFPLLLKSIWKPSNMSAGGSYGFKLETSLVGAGAS